MTSIEVWKTSSVVIFAMTSGLKIYSFCTTLGIALMAKAVSLASNQDGTDGTGTTTPSIFTNSKKAQPFISPKIKMTIGSHSSSATFKCGYYSVNFFESMTQFCTVLQNRPKILCDNSLRTDIMLVVKN